MSSPSDDVQGMVGWERELWDSGRFLTAQIRAPPHPKSMNPQNPSEFHYLIYSKPFK